MPESPLTWDAEVGRYRRADGSPVPPTQVRAELDRSLLATANRILVLADQLRAGEISLEEWRLAMKEEIKNSHLLAVALALGGWALLGPAILARISQIIRQEYGYLEGWVSEIKAGWTLDGRLMSRGALYVQASRGSFQRVQAEEMIKVGIDEEQNILHPAEHCDDCLAQTDLGWVPIGTLIPIGARQCLRNCKCSITYRRSAA